MLLIPRPLASRVFVLFGLISVIFAQNYDMMDKLRGVYIMGAFGDSYGNFNKNELYGSELFSGAATEQTALKGIIINNTCILTSAVILQR
jgi:hypothetical protein